MNPASSTSRRSASTAFPLARSFFGLVVALALAAGLVAAAPAPGAEAALRKTCASNSPARWSWTTAQQRSLSQHWCLKGTTYTGIPFWLVWQSNGNLVLYKKVGTAQPRAIWNTGTKDRGRTLKWGASGNFAIYDAAGRKIWSTATKIKRSGEFGVAPFSRNAYPLSPRKSTQHYYIRLFDWSGGDVGFEVSLTNNSTGTGVRMFALGRR